MPGRAPEHLAARAELREFELHELGFAELQRGLDEGRWTSERLVELYAERIRAIDAAGPKLRAVLQLNPDAPAQAAGLDAERRARGPRGPLHGLPILLKDNVATADRTETTAGSLALLGARPRRDAFLVTQLRAAGAVLLGKANLSEWANFRSPRSTSGWSARGGLCRNPYALDHNAGGSSTGSAVAAAASLAAAAVGTETDGSIVLPASLNGVVGLKPSVGRVSRDGVIPIAASQDSPGPLARSVADAAWLLGGLVGTDPRDPATAHAPPAPDYARGLSPDGLRGARLGVARTHAGDCPAAEALFEQALAVLRDAGAVLVDPVELPPPDALRADEFEVLLHEFKAGLHAYLADLEGAPVRSLAELIAFNLRHAAEELPHFGQELFAAAQERGGLDAPAYRDARARGRQRAGRDGIDAALRRHALQALVAPSAGPAWPSDLARGDHPALWGSSTLPAIAGYPALSVPAGHFGVLPFGLQFTGARWSEPTLLRLGYAFERAAAARRPPGFLATVTSDATGTSG